MPGVCLYITSCHSFHSCLRKLQYSLVHPWENHSSEKTSTYLRACSPAFWPLYYTLVPPKEINDLQGGNPCNNRHPNEMVAAKLFLPWYVVRWPSEAHSLVPVPSSRLLPSACLGFIRSVSRGETALAERPCSQTDCPSFCLPVVAQAESQLLWNSAQLFLVRNFGVSQPYFSNTHKNPHFHHTTSRELICCWQNLLVSWCDWTTGPGDGCEMLGDSRSGIWFQCGGKRKRDSP